MSNDGGDDADNVKDDGRSGNSDVEYNQRDLVEKTTKIPE